MVYAKKYFVISLACHIVFIFLVSLACSYSRVMRNQFIIFGIHSRKPTVVFYKKRKQLKSKKNSSTGITIKKTSKKIKSSYLMDISLKKDITPIKQKNASIDVVKKINSKDIKNKIIKNIVNQIAQPKKKEKSKENVLLKKMLNQEQVSKKKNIDSNQEKSKQEQKKTSSKLYQQHIQRAISRAWRPLVGVEKGALCTVLFTVSDEGKVVKARLVRRSGIVLYDLSVMKVAKKIEFHKSLWGKDFRVDFCQ